MTTKTDNLTRLQKALLSRLEHDRLYIDRGNETDRLWIGGGKGPSLVTVNSLVRRNMVSLVDCGLIEGARQEVVLVGAL